MSAIMDSVGTNIWPGDTVTTPDNSGVSVVSLAESGDPSIPNQIVVDTGGGVQKNYISTLCTVTSKASEQASTGDESGNSEVV